MTSTELDLGCSYSLGQDSVLLAKPFYFFVGPSYGCGGVVQVIWCWRFVERQGTAMPWGRVLVRGSGLWREMGLRECGWDGVGYIRIGYGLFSS